MGLLAGEGTSTGAGVSIGLLTGAVESMTGAKGVSGKRAVSWGTGRLTDASVIGRIGSGAGVSGLNWGTKVGVNLLGTDCCCTTWNPGAVISSMF